MGFIITGGAAAAIHVLSDPRRLALLHLDHVLGAGS
jgi:hypothetical protein